MGNTISIRRLAAVRGLVLLLALTLPGVARSANGDGAAAEAAPPSSPSAGMTSFSPYSLPNPHAVRIALLNTASGLDGAVQLSVLLDKFRRRDLETRMGLKLEVVNISNDRNDRIENSILYYRAGFLRPALILAEVIPGEQTVQPMRPGTLMKKSVDIQIMVGKELP